MLQDKDREQTIQNILASEYILIYFCIVLKFSERMSRLSHAHSLRSCPKNYALAITDTLNVINGKWKLSIIGALSCGNKRFSDIQKSIAAITPRMLSKELKELELNGMIERSVYDTKPVSIEYRLTASGRRFDKVLDEMITWGIAHREANIVHHDKDAVTVQ